MTIIDTSRHNSVFSAHNFGNRRVDVIGAGATGSAIVMQLAKLGIANIHVWDFDKVEEHNIANQLYGIHDIGKFKVDALAEIVLTTTGTQITAHNAAVDGNTTGFRDYVFLVTDTMSSRKDISNGAILFNPNIKFMIETRMGAELGMIYTINPSSPSQVTAWKNTLFDDAEAEVSACGASITVGPTANLIASYAVWQLILSFNGSDFPNELRVCLAPHEAYGARNFKE